MNCAGCGQTAPDMFYAGIKKWCRECWKARSRANRAAKIEQYREYDRQRAFRADRVAARKANAERRKQDPETRKRDHERSREWFKRNNLKRRAHIMVGNAIKYGLLKKQPCQRCGSTERVDAHHEDYTKPLDVTWLCEPCHGLRHREINAEKRRTDQAA